ncbi:MAG: hypothetical protein M3R02_21585 [Chloroflexota bacterium]|nr:hypothetical protein [Chloroflexota bacterium]
MARVTLTIEADHEELPAVLQQLGTMTVPEIETTTQGTEAWDEAELGAFLDMIKPDAREILVEIARRPEGYPWAEMQERLGLGGLAIAGRMSSIGHVMNRFPGKKPLHERDYQRRVYRMDPDTAKMILRYAG